jgi:signal transduction histidine kinase
VPSPSESCCSRSADNARSHLGRRRTITFRLEGFGAVTQDVSQIDEYDRLTRLINQILTLARAEAREITMARQPIDLSVLGSAVAEQSNRLPPRAASR